MCLHVMSFENTVGKREIAHNKQFLLYIELSTISLTFEIVICKLFQFLDWSKLKQIADDILKCTQNEKHLKWKI